MDHSEVTKSEEATRDSMPATFFNLTFNSCKRVPSKPSHSAQ
jgi:hypothetical protein